MAPLPRRPAPPAEAPAGAAEETPGSALAGLAPGAALARVLEAVDPEVLDDGALVEAVAAAGRLGSWAQAVAARVAAVLAGRESMNPAWSPAAGPPPEESCVAPDELAMRLACTRRAAASLVAQGRAFAGPLAATGDALAEGRIDPARARAVAERLIPLPVDVAQAVEERVLPGAERRTVTELRRDLERALLEVDPHDAAARHERACHGRRVDRPRLLPDGMAGLWAVLPAVDATRLDRVLDAAARAARSSGDPRTLDQLRADGLRDLVVGVPDEPAPGAPAGGAETDAPGAETAGTGTGAPDGRDTADRARRSAARAQVRVTVPLSTLLGVDDRPGELDGYGPVDAVQARALAAGGVWRRLVTDPLSGAVLDVGRRRYRAPSVLADHVRERDGRCARPGCTVPASACDLDHTVAFHGPAAGPRGRPPGDPERPPGVDGVAGEQPAGPPGSPGTGTTSAANLGPLCRRDHRLKTDGGFRLVQREPGVFDWVTPTGHRYRVVPGAGGAHTHLGRGPVPSPDGAPPS